MLCTAHSIDDFRNLRFEYHLPLLYCLLCGEFQHKRIQNHVYFSLSCMRQYTPEHCEPNLRRLLGENILQPYNISTYTYLHYTSMLNSSMLNILDAYTLYMHMYLNPSIKQCRLNTSPFSINLTAQKHGNI